MKRILFITLSICLLGSCQPRDNQKVVEESMDEPLMEEPIVDDNDLYAFVNGEYTLTESSSRYSATINLAYIGDRQFTFILTSVSPDGCTGDLEGVARIDEESKGYFASEKCTLAFQFFPNEHKVEILEENCPLTVVPCSFKGSYRKK